MSSSLTAAVEHWEHICSSCSEFGEFIGLFIPGKPWPPFSKEGRAAAVGARAAAQRQLTVSAAAFLRLTPLRRAGLITPRSLRVARHFLSRAQANTHIPTRS